MKQCPLFSFVSFAILVGWMSKGMGQTPFEIIVIIQTKIRGFLTLGQASVEGVRWELIVY